MNTLIRSLLLILLGLPPFGWAQPVPVLSVRGAIGPATADYLERGLDKAAAANARLVVLKLDTPGGLDTAMRAIIQAILAAPVPVACYVAPSGARAASAGTYILYACHIAAMAPGTNLGAATPVMVGGRPAGDEPVIPPDDRRDQAGKPAQQRPAPAGDAMLRKQVHDAAAYIRSLAELRGRNAAWAERAVREAVSLSAGEALRLKVIDLLAADLPELLARLDGRVVRLAGGAVKTLATRGARTTDYEPDWRSRLLAVLGDPAIAYILMLLGMYGLVFEFTYPGFGVAGVVGAICLLLALFAFQMLPINYAGLALILLGMSFMVAEAFLPSFGVLGLGGIVAFVIGSVMLIDTELPGYGIPWAVIIPAALVSTLFVALVAGMFIRARKRPVSTGGEAMPGLTGEVIEDMAGEGWANIRGETWRIRSSMPLARGARVRVARRDGLTLEVEPANDRGRGMT